MICLQGEWVISRVFEKSGVGSSSTAAAGKKGPPSGINSYHEVSSPSSVSLPALLEPSTASTDRESSSYDGGGFAGMKEHVPCFSTATVAGFNSLLEQQPPPPPPMVHDPSSSAFASYCQRHSLGASVFPSLRSLQENLHLPNFFFSTVAPPPLQGGADQMCAYGNVGQWVPPESQKVGATELDCMWSH